MDILCELQALINTLPSSIRKNISDGWHSFSELYEFRKMYNAALFNEWYRAGKYSCHKSKRHHDGEFCFGDSDMFVVIAMLPTGMISNHYHICDWNLFQIEECEVAKYAYDGHTASDVLHRIESVIRAEADYQ